MSTMICEECGRLRICCECDDGDGWCPGCVWCEPEGFAHRKEDVPDEAITEEIADGVVS